MKATVLVDSANIFIISRLPMFGDCLQTCIRYCHSFNLFINFIIRISPRKYTVPLPLNAINKHFHLISLLEWDKELFIILIIYPQTDARSLTWDIKNGTPVHGRML